MTQIATYIDSVLWQRNKTEILRLKQMFGLEKLEHDDDFASCVPFRSPLVTLTTVLFWIVPKCFYQFTSMLWLSGGKLTFREQGGCIPLGRVAEHTYVRLLQKYALCQPSPLG
jgi:hypothetical protein